MHTRERGTAGDEAPRVRPLGLDPVVAGPALARGRRQTAQGPDECWAVVSSKLPEEGVRRVALEEDLPRRERDAAVFRQKGGPTRDLRSPAAI